MLADLKHRLRRFAGRRRAVVLTYHSVVTRRLPFAIWHHMSAERFEEQIAYLARHHRCVSISEIVEALRRGRLRPYMIAVTFDDGFANNFHVALPILQRYGVPATFFLTAGAIGSRELLWPERLALILEMTAVPSLSQRAGELTLSCAQDKSAAFRSLAASYKRFPAEEITKHLTSLAKQAEVSEDSIERHPHRDEFRTLNWDEASALFQSALVEIGAHTITHPILANVPEDRARREIEDSKTILERRLGKVSYFAYPNGGVGDFTGKHRKMAIDAGYSAVFTAVSACLRESTDLYEIPRLGVGAGMEMETLKHSVNGGLAVSS
jgi:peptidoglycan/xylan/chitin deacetylase (PgdA/CDA1 family)